MGDSPFSDANLGPAVLQALGDVVAVVSRAGLVEHVRRPHPGGEPPRSRQSWTGKHLREVMSDVAADAWLARIRRCIDQGEALVSEHEVAATGMVWEVRLVPFCTTRALAVARDITHRHAIEAQTGRSARMEAVGQLAASIAHDFNNLLTAMSLNVSYLEEVLMDGQPGAREVEELSATLSRASLLTRHLVSFSRRAPQALRPLELGALVAELVPFLRMLTGPQITIREPRTDMPIWVSAEPNQLEQVLIILATNASDAMPGGGRFDIALQAAGESARIRVEDTGPGIPPELASRVFQPFFSTKGVGTGLGLASAQRIIETMGGSIEVAVGEGKGACFQIGLPAIAAPRETTGPMMAPTPRTPSSRILIVEDDDTLRRLICDLLEESGSYVIECAGDSGPALAAALSFQPDLVLCDVVLPSMSGVELARRMRSRGVRVLYLTGTVTEEELDGPYLSKPFTPTQLRAAVSEQLSRLD